MNLLFYFCHLFEVRTENMLHGGIVYPERVNSILYPICASAREPILVSHLDLNRYITNHSVRIYI